MSKHRAPSDRFSAFSASVARIDWSPITARLAGLSAAFRSAPDPDPVLPASIGEVGPGDEGEWCTGRPTGEIIPPSFAANPRETFTARALRQIAAEGPHTEQEADALRRAREHHPDELTW